MSLFSDIHEDILAQIGRVGVTARQAVENILTGQHRSPQRGLSLQFIGHKPYHPGDDLRHLDWHVYARSERHTIRCFEEEKKLRAQIVVDYSSSMGFPEDHPQHNKINYARQLAATLAFVMIRQGDQVGLSCLDQDMRSQVPPNVGMGHLVRLMALLEREEARGTTSLDRGVETLAPTLSRRGLVILITDGLISIDELKRALVLLQTRRQEVRLYQIYHPDEVTLPGRGYVKLLGMESQAHMLVDLDKIRPYYRQMMTQHWQALAACCHQLSVPLYRVGTNEDLVHIVRQTITGGMMSRGVS